MLLPKPTHRHSISGTTYRGYLIFGRENSWHTGATQWRYVMVLPNISQSEDSACIQNTVVLPKCATSFTCPAVKYATQATT